MSNYHLTISVRGRSALARDVAERRALVRALARVGGRRLTLFSLVDDHFHAAIRAESPARVGEGLRRVLAAQRPDLELKRPHLEPVGSRSYLRWLVRYLITQPEHHGLGVPSALWTGSCFQDLVGARLLGGFDVAPLRNELPRLRLGELFVHLGLGDEPFLPADDEALARVSVARLVDLAAGVHAVGPTLMGRSTLVVAARSLVVSVAAVAGHGAPIVARFLGVVPRAVRYLARREVDPRAVLALRRRLALEERVATGNQLRSRAVSMAVGSL